MINDVAYYNSKIDTIAQEVAEEAARAMTLFPAMNSPHEAAFVIEEEWEEYRQEVFKHNTSKPDRDTRPRQREELIQLAAMCMRAILDTIDNGEKINFPKSEPLPHSCRASGCVGYCDL
jgi:hypothetical protein